MATDRSRHTPDVLDGDDDALLIHIHPRSRVLALDLREVWRYRELLRLLVWRNTIIKYKQSLIGIGWAVVRPVLTMVIFTFVFRVIAGLRSEGFPYPVFAYAALLPWSYFSAALSGVSYSLSGNVALVSNVYFPRLVLPLAALFSGLVDFLIAFAVLLSLMAWYHSAVAPNWGVVLLPVFTGWAMAIALGFGLWLASLGIRYRDVQHLLPFLLTLWMLLTPVVYSADAVPQRWRLIYGLNPMVGVIGGFRWALLGAGAPDQPSLALGAAVTVAALAGGLYQLRRVERTFVDIA